MAEDNTTSTASDVTTNVENTVDYGIKNVHFHKMKDTGSGFVYEPGILIPGSSSLELDPVGDMAKVYADDMLYYTSDNNQGYTGKWSNFHPTQAFRIYALGNILTEDGQLIENADKYGNEFGLSFEFSGDVHGIRHFMYHCKLSRPKITSTTKTDKLDPKAQELDFTSVPDRYTRNVKTETTPSMTQDVYDSWFDTAAGTIKASSEPKA